jgi:hypothetical protein
MLLRRQRGLQPRQCPAVDPLGRFGDNRPLGEEAGAVNGAEIIAVDRAWTGEAGLAGGALRANDARAGAFATLPRGSATPNPG